MLALLCKPIEPIIDIRVLLTDGRAREHNVILHAVILWVIRYTSIHHGYDVAKTAAQNCINNIQLYFPLNTHIMASIRQSIIY